MTVLYIARHGESHANVRGILSHRVADPSLTERGAGQARALARWLPGDEISAVYSSPLRRARETASIVAARLGVPVAVREGLREVDVGALDGRSDEEAWSIYRDVVRRWRDGDLEARFPEGEDCRAARRRLAGVLREAAAAEPGTSLLMISHGEVLSQALPGLVDLAPAAAGGLDLVAVVLLEHQGGCWRCLRWNSTDHLALA